MALGGTLLLARRPKLGRALGIGAFVALACLSWGLASEAGVLAAVDPVRGLFGVVAWALYAAAWSHPWSVPDHSLSAAPEGEARGLSPRRPAPRAALAMGALGGLAALTCLAVSYLIEDRTRALVGRATAIVASILLISHAAALAVVGGRDDAAASPERLPVDGKVARLLFAAAMLVGATFALARLR
ncbi:MAG: hypothetical protein FJ095_18710 [Deltaproteobacteria bacterium]|nr:hypothetical protein [Deltaproteobacteria bacterium]